MWLEEQFEAVKLEKEAAAKELQSERLALQSLKAKLDGPKAVHEKALANVASTKTQIEHMSSEEGKREVIEEYRQGAIGKVEVSMAVKACFDYLKAQVSQDVLSSSSFAYPPHIQGSLPFLEDLEWWGGGVRLEYDEEEDEDDEEGEEDNDDEEGGDGGEG